jgi:hypothetical protein
MDGFSAHEWSKLTTTEQLVHCRLAALGAETYARSASSDLRELYKELAAQWRLLAVEVEREAIHDGPPPQEATSTIHG